MSGEENVSKPMGTATAWQGRTRSAARPPPLALHTFDHVDSSGYPEDCDLPTCLCGLVTDGAHRCPWQDGSLLSTLSWDLPDPFSLQQEMPCLAGPSVTPAGPPDSAVGRFCPVATLVATPPAPPPPAGPLDPHPVRLYDVLYSFLGSRRAMPPLRAHCARLSCDSCHHDS